MPAKGYSTIGMKPAVIAKLQEVTDKNYLGMFLPSTIIIMMNEIKAERYQVHSHKLRLDLTGRYNSITVRSDVREWLHANYALLSEEYHDKYRINCTATDSILHPSLYVVADNYCIPTHVITYWLPLL